MPDPTASRAALIPSIEVALFSQTTEQHACLDREALGGLVHRLLQRWAEAGSRSVLHRAPNGGIAPFVCCGLTPPDLPEIDRITWTDDLVTCPGKSAPTGPQAVGAGATTRRRPRSPWDRRELRIVVQADVDLFDVEAAESVPRSYGIAEHIDRTVVTAIAGVPGLTNVRSTDTALRDRQSTPSGAGDEPRAADLTNGGPA